MSKNSSSAEAQAVQIGRPAETSRRKLLIGGGAAALAVLGAGAFYAFRGGAGPAERPGLASTHAPSLGDPQARVHIVEFLDPACETCAAFFPVVKKLMADQPGRIRLSVRHVPFHKGSDEVVRMLEASRKQDRYWQTLEVLLATQNYWAPRHTAQPHLALQALATLDLDFTRLQADMRDPAIDQRMAQDSQDAVLLQVDKTPEYFVNGRQMASFGRQQLLDLIAREVDRAY